MSIKGNKQITDLEEQVLLIRKRLQSSPFRAILNAESSSRISQQITRSSTQPQQLSEYIFHLHTLTSKLSQLYQLTVLQSSHLYYDLQTAMKFAQIMRHNLMRPSSPQQFTDDEARQYRVLLNVHIKSQTEDKKNINNMKKDLYYQSILDVEMYNQRLQERKKQMQNSNKRFKVWNHLSPRTSFSKCKISFSKKRTSLLNNGTRTICRQKIFAQLNKISSNHYSRKLKKKILKFARLPSKVKESKRKSKNINMGIESLQRKSKSSKTSSWNTFKAKRKTTIPLCNENISHHYSKDTTQLLKVNEFKSD